MIRNRFPLDRFPAAEVEFSKQAVSGMPDAELLFLLGLHVEGLQSCTWVCAYHALYGRLAEEGTGGHVVVTSDESAGVVDEHCLLEA